MKNILYLATILLIVLLSVNAKEGDDCWNKCGKQSGYCEKCGPGKACCRKGWNDPIECVGADIPCDGHHCCSKPNPSKQDCWWICGKKGGLCSACGTGKACCRKGYKNPPACDDAIIPYDGHHCCSLVPIYETWGTWGPCSKSCGGGTRTRTSSCKYQNGISCPDKVATESCNEKQCEVPIYGNWGAWSPCSKSCEGGTRTRKRSCKYQSGTSCPDDVATEPCNKEPCEYCSKKLEAGIILDRSGSIAWTKPPLKNWHKTIDFVKDFLKAFDISEYNVHYGLARFSSSVTMDIRIKDKTFWSNSKIVDLLTSIYNEMPSGSTRMDLALSAAKNQWFCPFTCGLRPGIPKTLIFFTDGKPYPPSTLSATLAVAKALKDNKVKIITVGIGSGADFNLLKKIASDPKYAFGLAGFDYFIDIMNKMVKETCEPL